MSYSLEPAALRTNANSLAVARACLSTDRRVDRTAATAVSEPAPDWFVPEIWQFCLDWMARDLGAVGAGLLLFDLQAPPQTSLNRKVNANTNTNNDARVWATVGDAALPRLLWLHDHGSRPAWPTCMRRIPVGQWLACETVHGLIGDAVRPADSPSQVVGAKLAQSASTLVYVGFQAQPSQASALLLRARNAGAALVTAAQALASVRDRGYEAHWVRESRRIQVTQLASNHCLTAAESNILHHLIAGNTCHDIARKRAVTINTVKSQVKSIHGKLGVHRAGQIYGLL